MQATRIAIVGVGKIATDQHVPALAGNSAFELAAGVSRHHTLDGVPNYAGIEALLQNEKGIDAVAICTPPQVRYDIAAHALRHGLHVFLEKPPGANLGEVDSLVQLARDNDVALFASWHSREAAGVAPAARWLARHRIERVVITWKEDVRVWHPGQAWIWKAGGLGVFDPGINALSILTKLLEGPVRMDDASLSIPANCETPIAADLRMSGAGNVPVVMELDFLQTGAPTWDIEFVTDGGTLILSKGGAVLQIGDDAPVEAPDREYPNLYERYAELISERGIDADAEPLRLVEDAMSLGRRHTVEAFIE